ncbi:MAG: hypothetical protein ACRDUV_09480 [Pseudonocardiaceae bacterium]
MFKAEPATQSRRRHGVGATRTRPTGEDSPRWFLYDRVHAAVKARTRGYPPTTLGDLLARVFHDWDNIHGFTLEGGRILFGGRHLEEGIGTQLAITAARAGVDESRSPTGLERPATASTL